MTDVAERAGVSLGTVSHVLNHPERVTPATRERVEEAIRALRYRPNRLASTLARGRSGTIGLVLTDLSNSLFVEIARGAGRQADAAGMRVVLADGDSEVGREIRHLELFDELGVAGSMVTLSDEEHMAALVGARAGDRPLVLVNFSAPAQWFCSVATDNALGGYLATRHLIGSGRRRLAFVGGPDVLRPVHDRQVGWHRPGGRGARRAGGRGGRRLRPARRRAGAGVPGRGDRRAGRRRGDRLRQQPGRVGPARAAEHGGAARRADGP
jgi:LacI family transcriptional regulator